MTSTGKGGSFSEGHSRFCSCEVGGNSERNLTRKGSCPGGWRKKRERHISRKTTD